MTKPDRMSPAEAVTLCRLAKAACPQQQFDEYTPDAWFELLRDLRFVDCKDALFAVVRESPFVAPAEIRRAIKRVRFDRIAEFGPLTPPAELADDPSAEIKWQNALLTRIADGDLTREEFDADLAARGITGNREVPALEGVFRSPDDVDPWGDEDDAA